VIAVDTNVLVRVLVDDPSEPAQTRVARESILQADGVYLPQVVQVETVWVLESAYEFGREEIVSVLEHLAANQAYRLENPDAFRRALAQYRAGGADFADYAILATAVEAGAELVTFDRRLAQSPGARRLEARP
jgi:predicted nucleic-acid-binding protein